MQQQQGLYIRSPFVNAQCTKQFASSDSEFANPAELPSDEIFRSAVFAWRGIKSLRTLLVSNINIMRVCHLQLYKFILSTEFFGPCEVVVALLSSLLKEWFFLTYSLLFARYILLYAIWIRLVNEWRKWVMQYHIDIWMMDYQNGKWMMDWVGLPQSSSAPITNLPPPLSSKVASA